jgi:hypothetical protein
MNLVELKKVIRELLIETLVEKINSKQMPNGSSWTVNGGWAAKNKYGVTNYWYGKDEQKNKENANEFARHNDTKPVKTTEAFGLSFSPSRALGISSLKQKISKDIGVPLTQSGRQKKLGTMLSGTSKKKKK